MCHKDSSPSVALTIWLCAYCWPSAYLVSKSILSVCCPSSEAGRDLSSLEALNAVMPQIQISHPHLLSHCLIVVSTWRADECLNWSFRKSEFLTFPPELTFLFFFPVSAWESALHLASGRSWSRAWAFSCSLSPFLTRLLHCLRAATLDQGPIGFPWLLKSFPSRSLCCPCLCSSHTSIAILCLGSSSDQGHLLFFLEM